MTQKTAMHVDYQRRAKEFAVGDMVSSTHKAGEALMGRVVAVYPAIGMVDVEWPAGNSREPVETLQRYEGDDVVPPSSVNLPGGVAVVAAEPSTPPSGEHLRVAEAFVRKALYWGAPDRHYKATKEECADGRYRCPKCKEAILKPASYQRANGSSERLLACQNCLFLIKQCDIIGHPSYVDDSEDAAKVSQPFSRIRLTRSV